MTCFGYTAENWSAIARELRADAEFEAIARINLEMRMDHCLRIIRDVNPSYREELERLERTRKTLRDFVRYFYASKPEEASRFKSGLRIARWSFDEVIPHIDDDETPLSSLDLQLAKILRCLARGIEADILELRELAKTDLKWDGAGKPPQSRQILEVQVRGAMIGSAYWAYFRTHGSYPKPYKRKAQPVGPLSRYMFAVLEPFLAELRQRRGAALSWPTVMKWVERERERLCPPKF